ncbi:MAG: RNA methyltransferase [Actinomycetota bacterium]|nr:RNA methyltransferase [Actinomycetota bacterium]
MAARKLRRRAFRDAARAYLLEGPVPVREALEMGAPVREVFVAADYGDAPEIESTAAAAGAEVVRVSRPVSDALSETATPQGVVGVAAMTDVSPEDLPPDADLVLVLDQVRDPGNAGTLVRSAAAAGADAVMFTSGSVDPYSPKTVRAAAGALFLPAIGRAVAIEALVRELGGRGFVVAGADAAADRPYDSLDCTGPVAFVVGNEAWGIAPEHRGLLSEIVTIPMPGHAESLNAATAGALLLFEAVRQRRISSAAT